MELIIERAAHAVALSCDFLCIVVLANGALKAIARLALRWRFDEPVGVKREVWSRFAASLMLALEFALAADIAGSAVAPTWNEIGKLAAIAALRTALNLFLERDLKAAREAS